MSAVGAVHLVFSLVAIAAGGWVLVIRKGTRWHRTLGHVYGTTMVGVVVTSFAMYGLTGTFGPFHAAALVAGVTLAAGMVAVLGRRPKKGWMEAHAIWMSWSYIGLMAALVAESATRFVLPRMAPVLADNGQAWAAFWGLVGVASVGVCGGGWWLVRTRLADSIAATPEAMRLEQAALRVSGTPAAD